jgi:hypothetical protein
MSAAYCGISHLLLFSSLVLTIVALVLAWRDSAKESLICLGFVLLALGADAPSGAWSSSG